MTDYVYAMYSYLLDIDLYFAGNDPATTKIISNAKKVIDKYVKNPGKDTFEDVDKIMSNFYDKNNIIIDKYKVVETSVNNLSEMIFRTKQALYFKK